jgi:hypothetical protein
LESVQAKILKLSLEQKVVAWYSNKSKKKMARINSCAHFNDTI